MDINKWQELGTDTVEIDLNDITLPTGLSLRVSTERQEKNESLENQEIEGLEYINNKKYNLARVYKDVASGGSFVREGMNDLIDDINAGKIKRVVFVNAERLARDISFAINFSNICQNNRTIIEFMDSGKMFYKFNLMELMEYILTFFKSHAQREQISRDVKRRMATKLKAGQRMGGVAPYGYRWENKTLVIVEEEAKIVRMIFNDFIKGNSRASIARNYNRTQNFIWRMITNHSYIGYNKFGERHGDKKTGKQIIRKEFILAKGDFEPIIDKKTFEIANNILNSKYIPKIKNEDNPKFLFSGLIHCYCGNKMYGWSATKKEDEKTHYYSCGSRHNKDKRNNCNNSYKPVKAFEDTVINELIKISNEFKSYSVEEFEEEDTQKINYLESEKVKLDKSRSDLLKLVGIFSIEEIRNRTKDIDTTLKEVNSKL